MAGYEAGWDLPPAGQDRNWLKDNLAMFRFRADSGEEEFVELLEEIGRREDLKGILK